VSPLLRLKITRFEFHFLKLVDFLVGRAGLEPATFCTSGRCPNQASFALKILSAI